MPRAFIYFFGAPGGALRRLTGGGFIALARVVDLGHGQLADVRVDLEVELLKEAHAQQRLGPLIALAQHGTLDLLDLEFADAHAGQIESTCPR